MSKVICAQLRIPGLRPGKVQASFKNKCRNLSKKKTQSSGPVQWLIPVVHSTACTYPDAHLSCLDNGYSCWNSICLQYQNVIGVLPVSRCLTTIKHSNIKATCHCLIITQAAKTGDKGSHAPLKFNDFLQDCIFYNRKSLQFC